MLQTFQPSFIKEIIHHTDHIRSFILEVPSMERFDFIPGQFVTIELPISERRSQRLRSYSIASAPNGTNTFELLISHKAGGAGTTYLFEQGVAGLEISFRGPAGSFVLPESLERDICMICTGTGIAPFRSQIVQLLKSGEPTRNIHLVFGARHLQDAIYYDEFTQLAKEHPHFGYHVALSREHNSGWTGHQGYVHDLYTEVSNNGKTDVDFYLCGWKQMIHDAREKIAQLGYGTDRVHLESYD